MCLSCPLLSLPAEGRINPTTGHLQCSYHGWQFNAAGRCVALPQADSERQLEVAASSRRACVASHPVQAAQVKLQGGGKGASTRGGLKPCSSGRKCTCMCTCGPGG